MYIHLNNWCVKDKLHEQNLTSLFTNRCSCKPVCCFPSCRICGEYNSIANRMSKLPLNTAELVELDAYLKQSSRITASKLRQDVCEAARRLQFLMDYADLSGLSPYTNIHRWMLGSVWVNGASCRVKMKFGSLQASWVLQRCSEWRVLNKQNVKMEMSVTML